MTLLLAAAVSVGAIAAQEPKPVPKDSMRVSIPGCAKGYVFTVAARTPDQPGTADLPEGLHLRMNAPKKLMNEIKAHEGSMIEITGLMKKEESGPGGLRIGGVRIAPRASTGGLSGAPTSSAIPIDVESVRQIPGSCRTR
jgi:hypothetical protein